MNTFNYYDILIITKKCVSYYNFKRGNNLVVVTDDNNK